MTTREKRLLDVVLVLAATFAIIYLWPKERSVTTTPVKHTVYSRKAKPKAQQNIAPVNPPKPTPAMPQPQIAEAAEIAPIKNIEPQERHTQTRVVDKDGNEIFRKRPELKTKTDRFLFACVSRPIGARRLVLSPYKLDDDFRQALAKRIEVTPDDTEDDILAKEEVEAIKRDIANSIAAGEKASDVLLDFHAKCNAAAQEHAQARRELYRLIKEQHFEEAATFLEGINAEFARDGIMQLHVPQRLLEQYAQTP